MGLLTWPMQCRIIPQLVARCSALAKSRHLLMTFSSAHLLLTLSSAPFLVLRRIRKAMERHNLKVELHDLLGILRIPIESSFKKLLLYQVIHRTILRDRKVCDRVGCLVQDAELRSEL